MNGEVIIRLSCWFHNRVKSPLWRLRVRLRYWLTGDCGLSCGVLEPYGFVSEAECPIHDKGLKAE